MSMREVVEERIRLLHRHEDGKEHEHDMSDGAEHEHIGVRDGVPFSSGHVVLTALALLVAVDEPVVSA